MMKVYPLIFFTIIYCEGLNVQLEYFDCFSTWMHSRTPQKHRATITIFTSFYINFKYRIYPGVYFL